MKDIPIKFHLDKKILNKQIIYITIHECPVSITTMEFQFFKLILIFYDKLWKLLNIN